MPVAARPDPDPWRSSRLLGRWQVLLLGRVEARNGDLVLTRFNSQPTAALLARLALRPQQVHAREELADLLWPGAPAEAARNRLRQALSMLKRLLEAPGHEGPPVLLADRHGVRVNEEALGCDALDFERCLRAGRVEEARALYRGELMPGHYEEWVQDERRRLAALFDRLGAMPLPALEATPVASPRASNAPPPTLLPGFLTRFFGRERELAALRADLQRQRLITLCGMGGCGKTRLALEAARGVEGFERVVFVPLADCRTAAQALSQLRASLQLDAAQPDLLEQVVRACAERRVLVVLDNFEQLVAEGGAGLVQRLLARTASLHLLLTSRRVLGIDGEQELLLAPLPLPDTGARIEELARNPGAALFIDRARSVRPDFQVTPRNFEALAALCRALEGVPLALELAAARTRVYSLRELHDALARPLALLERNGQAAHGRAGRAPERHDSLRAALEWSWRLLSAPQQRFLAALSVFRGGFSVADAQAVCEEPQARELLEVLLADSLVAPAVGAAGDDADGEPLRLQMLELIRAYVAEKLDATRVRALRAQHRAHVLTQALGLQARGTGRLGGAELPNVQQALRSALEDDRPELALTLGLALRSHWDSQGMAPDLLALLCRAADSAAPDAPALPAACTMLAVLLLVSGDAGAARAMAERALVLAEDRPPQRAAALCAWVRVLAEGERRHEGLAACLDEAESLAADAPELRAQAAGLRGWLSVRADHDPLAAEAWFERAAAHWLAAGRVREARLLRYDRAICLFEAGRMDAALAQAVLCERECEASGEHARRVAAINLQGVVLARQRRWADAVQAYGRCVREAWAHHLHYWLVFALWNHGRNLARLRQPEDAARLMAFAEHHWRAHFGPLDAAEQRFVRQVQRLVQAQCGRARCLALWEEGSALTLRQAVLLADGLASP
jgi:predicted ATPase